MQVKNDAHIGQEITIFYFNLYGGTQITILVLVVMIAVQMIYLQISFLKFEGNVSVKKWKHGLE